MTAFDIPDLVQRLDAARSVLYAATLADRDDHGQRAHDLLVALVVELDAVLPLLRAKHSRTQHAAFDAYMAASA
jgi:hypothetical protein